MPTHGSRCNQNEQPNGNPTACPPHQSGSANATYVPPLFAPFLPPPHAMTTYCLPPTMYVDGVALPAAGSFADQSSLPVALSKARNVSSYVVAAMRSRPFS